MYTLEKIVENNNMPSRMKVVAQAVIDAESTTFPYPEECKKKITEKLNNYLNKDWRSELNESNYFDVFVVAYSRYTREVFRQLGIETGHNPAMIVGDYLKNYNTLPSSTQLTERMKGNKEFDRTELKPFIITDDDNRLPVAIDYLPVEEAIKVLAEAEPSLSCERIFLNSPKVAELRKKYVGRFVPIMYYMQERTSGTPGCPRRQFPVPGNTENGKIRKLIRPFEM